VLRFLFPWSDGSRPRRYPSLSGGTSMPTISMSTPAPAATGPGPLPLARRLVLITLRALGLFALWRYWHRRAVVILLAHGVMEETTPLAWRPLRPRLSPRKLEEYLRLLSRHYRFVSLSDAVEMLEGRRPIQPNCLVMTFDDGYRNQLTHALPVFRRLRVPFSIFIPSGKITRRALFAFDRLDYALQLAPGAEIHVQADGVRQVLPTAPRSALAAAFRELRRRLKDELGADVEYAPAVLGMVEACEARAGRSLEGSKEADDWASLLSWEELQAVASDPLLEIGSHTVDHTRLGLADRATIEAELFGSKRDIEARLGRPCPHLAYPNGSYGPAAVERARALGYVSGLTTDEGLNRPGDDLLTLRRIGLPEDADPTELLALVSGLSAALSSLKARVRRLASRARGPAAPRTVPG
jgi:peptidoglycan/xylan/chitin deacetylase (PgdA/CDA1 family)